MQNKPIDRWLALGGIAVAIALYLLPKTPLVILCSVTAIFLLLFHPLWNFPWIEQYICRRLIALSGLLTICLLLAYAAWPDQSQLARFHTIATNVGFNSQNQNQPIANIYIQNDARDADLVVYSAAFVATVAADQAVIDQLRRTVDGIVEEDDGIDFKVLAKEGKWFTVFGPVLSIDQIEKYKTGGLTFYFISIVLINENGTTTPMEHCGFVIGNNPRAILECPRGAQRLPKARR